MQQHAKWRRRHPHGEEDEQTSATGEPLPEKLGSTGFHELQHLRSAGPL